MQDKPKVAILLHTTFTRFPLAQKAIESFRGWSDFRIYVSDTGAITPDKFAYYRDLEVSGHKVFFTGWDTSPAITRNFLVDQIEEPFIWKIDDDFEFKLDDHYENDELKILDIFKQDESIGLAGMSVRGVGWKSPFIYDIEIKDGVMYKKTPEADAEMLGDNRVLYCDITPDCWVARKDIFPAANWDERYHVSEGLHTDFFMNLKYNTDYKVVYCPDIAMYTFKHEKKWKKTNEERKKSFYNRKRFRNLHNFKPDGEVTRKDHFKKLKKKWDLSEIKK